MSSISFNPNSNDDNLKLKNNNNQEKILFTKQQFDNSIMSALNKAGASNNQASEYMKQANSIFAQFDKNNDEQWSQSESQNGGSVALQNFYSMVNDAFKNSTGTQNTQGVSEIPSTEGVGATTNTQASNATAEYDVEGDNIGAQNKFADNFKNAADKKAFMKQELQDFISAGYKINGMSSSGDMDITNSDGTKTTMNLKDLLPNVDAETLKEMIAVAGEVLTENKSG
jgi:hypothetical protein